MATGMTPFRTGIPTITLDQSAPIPRRFVLQLADELAPADIVNGLCQRRMLGHRLHMQTLDANRLVLTNDAGRELVREITAPVGNSGMNTGDYTACFVAVLGTTFLLGKTPLGLRQFLFILSKVARVAHLLAAIQNDHIMQTEINAHLSRRDGQWRDVFFQQDADEVAP